MRKVISSCVLLFGVFLLGCSPAVPIDTLAEPSKVPATDLPAGIPVPTPPPPGFSPSDGKYFAPPSTYTPPGSRSEPSRGDDAEGLLVRASELAEKVTTNSNVSIIERLWKVKVKAIRHRVSPDGTGSREQPKNSRRYELLFEFTEDLTNDEIERISQAGMAKAVAFEFYLFDSENVVLKREPAITLDGEITGVRGDAFRMFLRVPIEMPIARIEAREPKVNRRSLDFRPKDSIQKD